MSKPRRFVRLRDGKGTEREAEMQCERIDLPVMAHKTDFPDVYKGISTRDLITVYKAGPTRLGGVLAGLSDEELEAQPHQGKWSIQEIAQHVADSEIMGAARLRQALAEPGTSFAVYDQAAWARTLRYGSRDRNEMVAALWLFSALRSSGTRLFNGAREEDWKKWGSHADWGRLTVRQLLELYADHGERHIEQIVELRLLLGNPVNVPRLLPTRLY